MDALDIISLDSAKNWLNIELAYTDDDETITRLIKSAIAWVEAYTSWRTFQREEILFNQQDNNYVPLDFFPDYGTGFWPGRSGVLWTPKHMTIYLFPFTITSVTDMSSPPADVTYTTVRQSLRTLLYALPNSMITLQTGFSMENIAQIPSPIIEGAYKWITYLYENRDSYKAELPTDIQILLNQYRRAIM